MYKRQAMQDEGWRDKERVRSLYKRSQENVEHIKDVLGATEADRRKFYAFLPMVPLFVASNYILDLVMAMRGAGRGQKGKR